MWEKALKPSADEYYRLHYLMYLYKTALYDYKNQSITKTLRFCKYIENINKNIVKK